MEKRNQRIELIKENYIDLLTPKHIYPFQILTALLFINEHLFNNSLTVQWMREECEITNRNFSGKFKFYLGKTPKEYILYHRTIVAKILLLKMAISASDVAYETGFSDASSFTNAFRKYIGCTPSHFQKMVLIKNT